jgi:acyl-coenzyme A synthetase/AMP-(fatty) acid ligase
MIAERIFDWAQRTPEKTAVIYNERPWSYRAFAEKISTAHRYFLRRGVTGPGYALLIVHNLLDFWVLSLALRNLGLTTVPVVGGPGKLAELELAGIRCVIVRHGEPSGDFSSVCKARNLLLISVSLDDEPSADAALPEPVGEPGGHVLLTSGTTGRYKMVLNTPAIEAAHLNLKTKVVGMDQDTLLSVFHFPASTAVGYRWTAAPWIVGGTTLIEQGRQPYRALLTPGLTDAVVVPSLLVRLLAAPANAFPRNDALRLTVGGGALTHRQIDQIRARITRQIFNTLGSTEAGNIAYTPLDDGEDLRWHRIRPERVVEIVSDTDHPLPVGEVGRLRIGTKDCPTAYLGDEMATKAYFKDGYFYPGDLAVARSDGRIALQGRSTDIINVGGLKVLPEPIENRLCERLEVSGVCLISMPNARGEEELYVAIESSTPIATERLRSALADALRIFPRTNIRYFPSLPRNEMGKLSRQDVRAQLATTPPPVIPVASGG